MAEVENLVNAEKERNNNEEHSDPDNISDTPNNRPERLRTKVAFFLFGCLIYATYSAILSGAQDILAGTLIQTSLVLVANIGPYFLVTLIAPYFMQRIPYFIRIVSVFVTETLGFLLLVCSTQVHWKLMGVALASIGYGIGEVSILALTTFYHEITVSSYAAGTGAGFVIAPLYYTAMTTWLCVSPNITLLIMAAMLLLLFVCYSVMDKKHLPNPNSSATNYQNIPYVPLERSDIVQETGSTGSNNGIHQPLSWQEKASALKRMLPHLAPLFFAWLSEYLIIQAVATTIAFPNAPFRPRDHYQYYISIFLSGEVVGRSYLALVSLIRPELVPRLKTQRLWILSAIEVSHLLFFVLASWYRFLPNVAVVLILSFTGGVTIGVLFINALSLFSDTFESKYREFVMGYAVVAIGCGSLVAALMGLVVEPQLRNHCKHLMKSDNYCFTRSKAVESIMSRCMAEIPTRKH